QTCLFVSLVTLDLILLALDVTRVLGADFDLHADLGWQAIIHVGPIRLTGDFEEIVVADFRTQQQLERRELAAERSTAEYLCRPFRRNGAWLNAGGGQPLELHV